MKYILVLLDITTGKCIYCLKTRVKKINSPNSKLKENGLWKINIKLKKL